MTDVLLATCAEMPDGEPDGSLLVEELAARDLTSRWVAWDDPSVDWAAAGLVAVRSTWDYELRRDEFLAWARDVAAGTRLVNDVRVLEWNTDKVYLCQLAEAGLPVVPTLAAEQHGELAAAVAGFDAAVVKPRVAAGGRGVVVLDGPAAGQPGLQLDGALVGDGPWIVQPLVESVRTEGETSVFVLGGEVVSQAQKLPAAGEIRVHEEFGGQTIAVDVTEEAATLASRVVDHVEQSLGLPLPVARVDLMRGPDGSLLLSELEVSEPGLYLPVLPGNAGRYADLLVGLAGG